MSQRVYEGWAFVELSHKRTRAGFVTEIEMFGVKAAQISMPVRQDEAGQDVNFVECYPGASIYSVSPSTEPLVREWLQALAADLEGETALPHVRRWVTASDLNDMVMPF